MRYIWGVEVVKIFIVFCFYELCEFLFVGICATPVGVGGEEDVFVRRWLAKRLDHAAVTTS